MNSKKNIGAELARAALDNIPEPYPDAKTITGLVKSGGRITGYQLSDGSKVTKEEGVSMAKNGEIKNPLLILICTPFTGQSVKGVFLCVIVMNLKENV